MLSVTPGGWHLHDGTADEAHEGGAVLAQHVLHTRAVEARDAVLQRRMEWASIVWASTLHATVHTWQRQSSQVHTPAHAQATCPVWKQPPRKLAWSRVRARTTAAMTPSRALVPSPRSSSAPTACGAHSSDTQFLLATDKRIDVDVDSGGGSDVATHPPDLGQL